MSVETPPETTHRAGAFGSDAPDGYTLRVATAADAVGARSVMLDTFYREFGYGYVPAWHADVVDIAGQYLDHPRHALFVAVRDGGVPEGKQDGEVVATAGVRSNGPSHPPHPRWLTERYPSGTTAQLGRVYVRAEHRRHGLARRLVEMARDFVAATPGYSAIYLHTNANVPGAEPFWRAMATEVCDARTGDPGATFQTVHFEIPIPR